MRFINVTRCDGIIKVMLVCQPYVFVVSLKSLGIKLKFVWSDVSGISDGERYGPAIGRDVIQIPAYVKDAQDRDMVKSV